MTAKAKFTVPWGYLPKGGLGFTYTGRPNSLAHLVEQQESGGGYKPQAICGVGVWGSIEFTSSALCPKCAKLAGITSVDDLERIDGEAEWGDMQRAHRGGQP